MWLAKAPSTTSERGLRVAFFVSNCTSGNSNVAPHRHSDSREQSPVKRNCQIGSVFMNHAALVAYFIAFKGHDHILPVFEFDDMGESAVFGRDLDLLDALALDVFNVKRQFSFRQRPSDFTRHHGHRIRFQFVW